MLAAVPAALLPGDRQEGGAALEALPRHPAHAWIWQVGCLESSRLRYLPLHRCYSRDALCLRPVRSGQITAEVFLHLRYEGTDCALMVTAAGYPSNAQSCQAGDFRSSFTKRLAVDLRTRTEASIIVEPALSLLCSTVLCGLHASPLS